MPDGDAFPLLLTARGRQVLDSLGGYDPATALADAERLRRSGVPADLANAALTQARLRGRAREKFGDLADRMFFTEDGVQQATRPPVARLRAQRYAGLEPDRVLDLCCGIGSDLAALASVADRVVGVDRDPLTAAVAAANVEVLGLADRVAIEVGDVTELPAGDLAAASAVFIDPARRGGRGRVFHPEAMSPPLSAVIAMAEQQPALGAKLAPGVAHDALPPGTEAEWVSDGGDLIECALWFGPLAGTSARRATVLPSGATIVGDGTARAPVGPVGRFLHEPDSAVIRAGLVAEVAESLGARLLDPHIAYLTSADLQPSPFVRSYAVTDVVPFSLKRLRALLRDRGVGRLTVKKRGFAMEPEALRKQLRLSGENEATVILTRIGDDPVAILADPV